MKAETQYTDLEGIVAADISDLTTITNDIDQLAANFGVDTKRYDVIGLDIYGVMEHSVRFLAIDREQSSDEKEHMVRINIDDPEDLSLVFKRLHLILVDKYKKEYLEREIDETIDISKEE